MAEKTALCTCPEDGKLVFLGHLKTCPEVAVPEPEVRVTRYEVSCLPRDDVNARSFTVYVKQTSDGLWIATDNHRCLNAAGEWVVDRSGLYVRHDKETALRLAKAAAPRMTVNGHTVADVLAKQEVPDVQR